MAIKKQPNKARLSDAQNERLRQITRQVMQERFAGVASRMAQAVPVSQPSLSRFLSGDQGAAEPLALKILALAGMRPEELGLTIDVEVPRPGTLGLHPAWAEAEAAARKLYPYVPEEAWVAARRFSLTTHLESLSPEMVFHLAMAADAATSRKAS